MANKKVRAKKFLGQHFLLDEDVCARIAATLSGEGYNRILEVGPGMGVLTKYLTELGKQVSLVELDRESVAYLREHFPDLSSGLIEGDFLKLNLDSHFKEQFALIGNYPYNISSQILFKMVENRHLIPEGGGMFQKEVAERVASKPGSKVYGVISVLIQAYYDVEYCFTVPPEVFNPPPKVNSGVIRLRRKENYKLDCDERLFRTVVKTAFGQRRKTLSNALKSLIKDPEIKQDEIMKLRAERLSVEDFVQLTNRIANQKTE
jgi:16S rRNA (adenine1518-N6/adenine1519-N6)-dimethyltransferase